MTNLVIHTKTDNLLQSARNNLPHAVVFVGERGIGKRSLMMDFAASALDTANLESNQYAHIVQNDGDSISIDTIRELQHFLSRKSTRSGSVQKIVIIPDAGHMTTEAQNALLKTLEEPPAGSMLLLSSRHTRELLPTVMSRLLVLTVTPPDQSAIELHFTNAGYDREAIKRAIIMTGGLPGLMTELLQDNQQHPFVIAASHARSILQLDTFGRLALVEILAKQRETCLDTLRVMQQMATISLQDKSKAPKLLSHWRKVLSLAYDTENALQANANTKLVLTHFMLEL